MFEYLIPAASAVVVALVGALSTMEFGRRKKQSERAEARANIRMEESRLSMEMMAAAISLGLATFNALEDIDGLRISDEMKRAKETAISAQEEYARFLKKITSCHVAK